MTRRLLAVLLPLTAALLGTAPAHADVSGLRYGPALVRLPQNPDLPSAIGVRTDRAGHIYVERGQHISTFTAAGAPIADWQLPGPASPRGAVSFDVAPDGMLYAVSPGSDTVLVYDRQGDLLRTWGGAGVIDQAWGLTVDPRGTVLVTDGPSMDSPYGPRAKRFTTDGTLLGEPPIVSAVAGNGARWLLAGDDVLVGWRPDGTPLTVLGRNCFENVDPLDCPTGPGGTDGANDIVGAPHGGFAIAQPHQGTTGRVSVFDARGRPQISCIAPRADHLVTSLDYAGHGLVVADGLTVRRARFAATPGRHCAQLVMRITHVSAHRDPRRSRTWVVRYRLSRRARVWMQADRLIPAPCHIPTTDTWDRRQGCRRAISTVYRRVAGGRGRHSVRLRRRNNEFRLISVGPQNEGFNTPFMRLR